MKALEKDRAAVRDPPTASPATFSGTPRRRAVVEARPPSRGYRLKKFVKRNKLQVIAASVVLLTLLAGVAGTTFGMIRAEKRRQESERNLAFAKKGNKILGSVFAGLDPKKNYADVGELSKALTDNLKQAVKELEGSAIGDPLEVATMQTTLGLSLLGLGESGIAVAVFQKARDTKMANLGPDHADTLTTLDNLASAYRAVGKLPEAIALFESVRDARTQARPPRYPDHAQRPRRGVRERRQAPRGDRSAGARPRCPDRQTRP